MGLRPAAKSTDTMPGLIKSIYSYEPTILSERLRKLDPYSLAHKFGLMFVSPIVIWKVQSTLFFGQNG